MPLDDVANWWEYRPGAYWKRPGGKGTTINGRDNHPVTHVALEDVEAYAAGPGKQIPTESEWERAARGGLEGAAFAWGDEHFPEGRCMANAWQGEFPWQNLTLDGYERTSPVTSFPPNGYGLYDITGQRVGVDERLVRVRPGRAVALSLLRAQPAGGGPDARARR